MQEIQSLSLGQDVLIESDKTELTTSILSNTTLSDLTINKPISISSLNMLHLKITFEDETAYVSPQKELIVFLSGQI